MQRRSVKRKSEFLLDEAQAILLGMIVMPTVFKVMKPSLLPNALRKYSRI